MIQPELYSADWIFELRYVRSSTNSFAGLWDQALHLVTSHTAIRTAPKNLNFIFSDEPALESQWKHLYTRLPYLLSYALDLSHLIAGALLGFPPPPTEHMLLHRQIALALYADELEYLNHSRRTSRTVLAMQRKLNMRCVSCGSVVRGKLHMKKLYMMKEFACRTCSTAVGLSTLAIG